MNQPRSKTLKWVYLMMFFWLIFLLWDIDYPKYFNLVESQFDLLLVLRLQNINEIELLDKTINLELGVQIKKLFL